MVWTRPSYAQSHDLPAWTGGMPTTSVLAPPPLPLHREHGQLLSEQHRLPARHPRVINYTTTGNMTPEIEERGDGTDSPGQIGHLGGRQAGGEVVDELPVGLSETGGTAQQDPARPTREAGAVAAFDAALVDVLVDLLEEVLDGHAGLLVAAPVQVVAVEVMRAGRYVGTCRTRSRVRALITLAPQREVVHVQCLWHVRPQYGEQRPPRGGRPQQWHA